MFDEDFSDFCGDFADLDGDGTVDMDEYLNEEDDYNRIMGNDDDYEDDEDDYSFDDDDEEDEDENFESDDEETWDEEDDNTDDDDSDEYCYNASKEEYRIAQAVYNNFPIVSQNFKKREVIEDLRDVLYKVYFSDKNAGLQILIFIVSNFQNAVCKGNFKSDFIISEMIGRDNNTESDVILKYIYEHPKFEKTVLGKQYSDSETGILWYDDEYIYYLCKRHDIDRIISSYQTLCSNPNLDKSEFKKDKLLDYIILHLNINGVRYADKRLYDFFKSEIESLGKPIKISYLMEKLNAEEYGKPLFSKTDNGKIKCIYCENDEPETDEEQADSDETEGGFEEEFETSFDTEQRISDLEEKLNEAIGRIALLEQILGVTDEKTKSDKNSPKPSTTPEDENDFFEYPLSVMGVQYADEYAVKNATVGDTVMFLPEPENKYDKNAILVLDIKGYKLGYIPRWANRQLLKGIESTGAYGKVNRVGPNGTYIDIDVWINAGE